MKETTHQENLSLSDDLIEVSTQLSDDAEHLAASYPAGKPNLWAAQVVQPARPSKKMGSTVWRRGLAAAAAVLVIAPTTWFASGLTWSNQNRSTHDTIPGNPVAPTAPRSSSARLPNPPAPNAALSLLGMPRVDQQDRPLNEPSYQRVILVPVDMWEHVQANRVWQEHQFAELARRFDRLQKENSRLRATIGKQ